MSSLSTVCLVSSQSSGHRRQRILHTSDCCYAGCETVQVCRYYDDDEKLILSISCCQLHHRTERLRMMRLPRGTLNNDANTASPKDVLKLGLRV